MSFQPWQKGSGTSADTTGKMNDILGNLQSSLDELAQRSNTMEKQITTPRFSPAHKITVPDKVSPFKFTKVTAPTVHFSGDSKHSSNVKRQDSTNFPAPPPVEEKHIHPPVAVPSFEPNLVNHQQFDNRASFQAPNFPAPPPNVAPTEKFKINDIDNLLEDIEGLDLDSPLAGKQVGNAPTTDYSVPVNKYNSPSSLYAKNATNTINNTLNNIGFTKNTPSFTNDQNNTQNNKNNPQHDHNYSYYAQNNQNDNAPTEYTHPTTTKPMQKQEPAQKSNFQEPAHQKPTGFNLYSDPTSSSKRTPAEANAEVETAINRLKNLGQKLEPNQELTKLTCFKCNLDINREAATVLGQNFHPDCFTCSKCMQPLKTGVEFFVVGQNQPFCKSCYEDTLTTCFACDEKITQGRIVKALGHEYR